MSNAIAYEDIMVQQPNTNALIITYIMARKGRELLPRNIIGMWDGS